MTRVSDVTSKVTITINDGEVKEYIISAGRGIASYLARDAGMTGILTLWNKDQSYCVPVASIRDWTIEHMSQEEEPEDVPSDTKPRRRRKRGKLDDPTTDT